VNIYHCYYIKHECVCASIFHKMQLRVLYISLLYVWQGDLGEKRGKSFDTEITGGDVQQRSTRLNGPITPAMGY